MSLVTSTNNLSLSLFIYYKAIIKINGLDLNVLIKEENLILNLIDKIVDPREKKKKTLTRYIEIVKEETPTTSYIKKRKDLK